MYRYYETSSSLPTRVCDMIHVYIAHVLLMSISWIFSRNPSSICMQISSLNWAVTYHCIVFASQIWFRKEENWPLWPSPDPSLLSKAVMNLNASQTVAVNCTPSGIPTHSGIRSHYAPVTFCAWLVHRVILMQFSMW